MQSMLQETIIDALSWTMLHSIWQGIIMVIILYIFLQHIPVKNAAKRYNFSVGILAIFGLIILSTFVYYVDFTSAGSSSFGEAAAIFIGDTSSINTINSAGQFSLQKIIGQYSGLVFRVWVIGVVLFSLKLFLGYAYLQYLKHPKNNKSFHYLDDILSSVQQKVNTLRKISIYATDKIMTPIVVGWIKPTILLPLSMVNGLESEEIEAILAHEIAHIIRNDWLINVIQSLMEVLLYFNPAVWWISAQIRIERENACDDWALSNGFDKIKYAKLLCKVKNIQTNPLPGLALGLTENKNQTKNRIQRILGNTQNQNIMKDKILAIALILFIGIGFAFTKSNREKLEIPFLSSSVKEVDSERAIEIPKLSTQAFLDTIPKTSGQSKVSIMQNGKSMTIEKENGKITRMEVDGELIDPSEYDQYMDEFGTFSFEEGNGFNFRSHPGANFFKFDNGGMWNGFNDNRFNMMFKKLDSMKVFDWGGFSNDFKMDSLHGRMLGMDDIMDQLRDHMKGFNFEDLEGFRNFNFGNDFNFMEDFDFGPEFDFNFGERNDFNRSSGKISDKIGRELSKDGLLKEGVDNEVELTGKEFKINGKKQSSEVYEKYKRIFEDYSGIEITKDSRINLTIEGKSERKRGLRRI